MKNLVAIILLTVLSFGAQASASELDSSINRLSAQQQSQLSSLLNSINPEPPPSAQEKLTTFSTGLATALNDGAAVAKIDPIEYRETLEGKVIVLYVLWANFSSFILHILVGITVLFVTLKITWVTYKSWGTDHRRADDGQYLKVFTGVSGEHMVGIFALIAASCAMSSLIIFSY